MEFLVNILGTITVGFCAFLLLRAYAKLKTRLLLWSGLCFAGLTASNALLFVDLAVMPHVDFYPWRLGVAAGSVMLLVYGLVFESN